MTKHQLFKNLHSISSKKGVMILFIMAHLVLLLMMTITFPRINAQIETQAFDLKTFGYTLSDAEVILQKLDESTKDLYIFPQLLLFDILYPALLALFLSTLMIRLGNLCQLSPKILSYLFMLPFVGMIFDYIENIFILLMITETVDLTSSIVSIASMCTLLKGMMTMISWVIILGLFVLWVKRKYVISVKELHS